MKIAMVTGGHGAALIGDIERDGWNVELFAGFVGHSPQQLHRHPGELREILNQRA